MDLDNQMEQELPSLELIHSLGDHDVHKRREAAALLAEHPFSGARDALLHALSDFDEIVRRRAARALGALGGVDNLPFLFEALNDEEDMVCEEVVMAMSRIDRARTVDMLLDAFADPEHRARAHIALALADLDPVNSIPALVDALRGSDETVAISSALALGKARHPAAAQPLVDALQGTSDELWEGILAALMQIGDADALSRARLYIKESRATNYARYKVLVEDGETNLIYYDWKVQQGEVMGKSDDQERIAPAFAAVGPHWLAGLKPLRPQAPFRTIDLGHWPEAVDLLLILDRWLVLALDNPVDGEKRNLWTIVDLDLGRMSFRRLKPYDMDTDESWVQIVPPDSLMVCWRISELEGATCYNLENGESTDEVVAEDSDRDWWHYTTFTRQMENHPDCRELLPAGTQGDVLIAMNKTLMAILTPEKEVKILYQD